MLKFQDLFHTLDPDITTNGVYYLKLTVLMVRNALSILALEVYHNGDIIVSRDISIT